MYILGKVKDLKKKKEKVGVVIKVKNLGQKYVHVEVEGFSDAPKAVKFVTGLIDNSKECHTEELSDGKFLIVVKGVDINITDFPVGTVIKK